MREYMKNLGTLAIAGLVATSAFAETSTTSGQLPGAPAAAVSTTETGTALRDFTDDLYLSYFGTFHGPVVNDMSSPFTVDRTGKTVKSPFNAINIDSELTTAYLISQDIGVGAVVPFLVTPVMGQGLTMGDAGIKAFDKKTVSTPDFNLYTNLIVQAPTSDYSQSRNMKYALKTTPNARYHFAGSRVSVGTWTEMKAYVGVTKDKAFKLWAEPYVSYQLSRTLAANLGYEMEADHMAGLNKSNLDFTAYQTDLQPGLVWAITPKVIVNPYLQLFTGNKVTTDRTALGATISASVL